MASKFGDVVERSVSTVVQAGSGAAAATALGWPGWTAPVIAFALSVLKNVVGRTQVVAAEVAKVAPVVGQVATEVQQVAQEADKAMHAG